MRRPCIQKLQPAKRFVQMDDAFIHRDGRFTGILQMDFLHLTAPLLCVAISRVVHDDMPELARGDGEKMCPVAPNHLLGRKQS